MSLHWIPLRSVCFHLLLLFIQIAKIPLSLLVSRLNRLRSLSLSLCIWFSKPLAIFVASCWTLSHMSMFSLYCREPRDRPRTPDVASSVLSREEGSPPLVCRGLPTAAQEAVGLLCCKGTLLAHVQFGVHQDLPSPFVQNCLPASQPQVFTGSWSYSSPHAGLSFPLVELDEIPLYTFLQAVEWSLCMAAQPSHISTTPLNFVSPAKLLQMHYVQSSRSLRKRLSSTGPSINPCSTSLVTHF